MRPLIRRATETEYKAVLALLESAGLPTAGLEDHLQNLFVLLRDGALLGAVAFEDYHPDALLRSLVVAPHARGQGHGRSLLEFIAGEITRRGYRAAYGLTTTIPELLSKSGFTELQRADLPPALLASAELRGACPATARAFGRAII